VRGVEYTPTGKNRKMKRFSEQFNTKAMSVKLTAAERRELRARLVSYLEYHPSSQGIRTERRSSAEAARGAPISFWRAAGATGLLTLTIGVGLASMAERSLPGDALYAVKIRFNEEVRSTLALTPYEKIEWETERLNRRVAEVRLLANEGRLTKAVERKIAEAVRTHGESARRGIEELRSIDKEEAALAGIQLATAIDVQSVSLKVKEEGEPSTANDATTVKPTTLVATALEDARRLVAGGEEELPSYERLMAQVELDTTRARELLNSVRTAATEEERNDISRRLEDIDRTVGGALTLRKADEDDAARDILLTALQRTQRLIVFMTNIDVRKSVAIEAIVPIVPTHEERAAALKVNLASIELNLQTLMQATTSAITDTAVLESVTRGLGEVEELFTRATTSFALGELDAAETSIDKALALSRDILALLFPSAEPALPTPEEAVSTTTPTTTPPAEAEDGSVSAETNPNTDLYATPPTATVGTGTLQTI
jgi:hypothetical protein